MYGRPSRLTGGLGLSGCRLFFRPFGACVSSLSSTACALGCTLSLLRSWVCVRWRFFQVVGWDCGGGRCDFGSRGGVGSLHGRFATGTDEGVRPYTCAGLRLRWTGESARPHTFLADGGCSHMCLLGGSTGRGFSGQDSGAFFAVFPEVGIRGLDWFVGNRGDGGEFRLLGDRFVLFAERTRGLG
jgi:hypothetical protein